MKIETKIRICTGIQCVCIALMLALALTGCASAPPRVELQQVKVPVPVECREPEPDRPVMPTESLAPGADPFTLMRAALAEIDRREGYETRLRAALEICTAPVKP